ncbi:hypothetical protein LIA77_07104 [Sarocladium implicatum]|nr:hypothetical protein LIA77_07104 [Sarocladium implicatum]
MWQMLTRAVSNIERLMQPPQQSTNQQPPRPQHSSHRCHWPLATRVRAARSSRATEPLPLSSPNSTLLLDALRPSLPVHTPCGRNPIVAILAPGGQAALQLHHEPSTERLSLTFMNDVSDAAQVGYGSVGGLTAQCNFAVSSDG